MNRLLSRGSIALLLAAGLPVAVDQAHAAASAINRVAFACPAGQTLTVEFDTADLNAPAVVHPPAGPSVTLPVEPHADGIQYGDARHELRGKGRTVTWTEAGKPPLTCTEARSGK
ncbi:MULTISPECIES: MliC family protein [Methylobacterium]|uniref:MliC family protein n=2 Tax=Pseudomonadota TaxID=1224 RepID=UPI0011C7E10B|nr:MULTISPECIES: MliC family protein [Methylobacterium]TXN43782.1 lysozyme inhibitor [Methylobacterium sp. WL7]TXN57043.1 lysozyme inhibitor [Methylobacterium sp. WL18]GJE20431.1 hypothetical protein JHFBIEKO_0859 [Methylobacterium mesophilicum]